MVELRFSQRMGHAPIRTEIQRDGISGELRNGLWNVIRPQILEKEGMMETGYHDRRRPIEVLAAVMWQEFFKEPMDTVPYWTDIVSNIRTRFFKASWTYAYDFAEWLANRRMVSDETVDNLNRCLAEEKSAYRFVDRILTPIVDEIEIATLDASLSDEKFAQATAHLRRALELHSDRDNPDYRNSIKESISAVEAMARLITGEPKATLGAALKYLEEKHGLHPALKSSWSSLYGYTSDEGGIRHAMTENEAPDEPLSRLMLVSCSSFVNYLKLAGTSPSP